MHAACSSIDTEHKPVSVMSWTNGSRLAEGTQVLHFESGYDLFESGCITHVEGQTFFVPDGSDGECCELETVFPTSEIEFKPHPVVIGEGQIGLQEDPYGFLFSYSRIADLDLSLHHRGTLYASVPKPD